LSKIDPDFHRQQLGYWQDHDNIKRMAGGYYALAERTLDEGCLFMVVNKLYKPSYINLETALESALAYYQVIRESPLGATTRNIYHPFVRLPGSVSRPTPCKF